MPPPVTQTRVDFKACEKGSMLCVTPEEGKTILRNKIATASWARRARDVINYYRSQD